MECPYCDAANTDDAENCVACGKVLPKTELMGAMLDNGQTVHFDATIPPPPKSPSDRSPGAFDSGEHTILPSEAAAEAARAAVKAVAQAGASSPAPAGATLPPAQRAAAGDLAIGSTLGGRYRVEKLLGTGGMGSVYKAHDIELDRAVALKIIRPLLAQDPEILARFKQEIILSREVTHRNVVRIYDLGEADGTRFISMEFVEGTDLSHVLQEKGALPVGEAVDIIEQVCVALDAAHNEGVVHRDLKPQNIMMAKDGRVVVMDFGIARTLESGGMTQTGALLGTPDYMSPEQVKGEKVDARSDLFALGIIFYQLLTGQLPYKGDTPMAAMFTRTQAKAAPVRDLNPELPGFLGDVVGRCLEIQPHKRYQSAREILQDLAVWRGGSTHMTIGPTMMRAVKPTTTKARKRLQLAVIGAAVAALVALGTVGVMWLRSRPAAPETEAAGPAVAPEEVVSLAILPFRNATEDPELGWLGPGLAEMLRTDVGQTASLRMVPSDRVHQILRDLRITPNTSLEEVTLRRVAEFSNADTVVWGQVLKFGDQIRIDATVRDFERHQTATLKAEAADENQLLRAVQELAQGVRDNLALSRSAVREAEEQAFIPSASSMVSMRRYTEGLELMRQGNNLEAVTAFETAIEEDADFALAHSELSQAYLNLGRNQKAEEASRTAVDLSEDLPTQERYLILAQNARVENDYEAGIDAYKNLLQTRPADADLNYEIALLYEQSGELDLARERLQTALDSDPQNPTAQLAMGRVFIKIGDTQDALAPLNQALSLAIQADNQEARANTLQALGIAYRSLGRRDEALKNFEESLGIKREINDQRGMAASLSEIGYIQDLTGQVDEARASYQEALDIRREIGDDKGVGRVLMSMGNLELLQGNYDEALRYSREALRIQIDIGDESNQARSLHNIGFIYDQRGEYSESLVYYQQALDLREKLGNPADIADTLHNFAETNTFMGRFQQAQDYYVAALEQRREAQDETGAAIESFSLGRVFGYQGRYAASLASTEEALEIFRRLGETGRWYVEALASYGNALGLLGRFDEAGPVLDEALGMARELQDDALIAQTLKYQGDLLFYLADFDAARTVYQQAEGAAVASGDPYLVLSARADIARNELARGKTAQASPIIETVLEQAQSRGALYIAARCTLCLSSVQLQSGQTDEAEKSLRKAMREAENMGAGPLVAQSHHLLAGLLRRQGNDGEAARHADKAAEVLDEIRTEAGSDAVLQRSDLKPIADAAP